MREDGGQLEDLATRVEAGVPNQGGAPENLSSCWAFPAELALAELDSRGRPGMSWPGAGVELSRAHLVFRSRRMCYLGRSILVAVKLVGDDAAPLLGTVSVCDYDGDAKYRTLITLQAVPDDAAIREWVRTRGDPDAM